MDTLSPADRSARMARVKGKGSSAELTVRRLVHRLGYRYRLHGGTLLGRPDLVFPGRKKVIFVHGCFWHRHPDPDCKLARLPKSQHEFWVPKLGLRDYPVQIPHSPPPYAAPKLDRGATGRRSVRRSFAERGSQHTPRTRGAGASLIGAASSPKDPP